MAYSKNTWATGDVITAEKLNSIENAVGNVSSSVDSMAPSVAKIDNIESTVEDLSAEIASARNYNSSGTANTLGGRIDELVRISNTQPGGNNEIWVNSNSNTIMETQVPTYSEFEALRDSIAQEYSESTLYSIGDYVIHEEQLYRCTTEITTAEAWNDAHWTRVVFGNEVIELKNQLNYLPDGEFYELTKNQYYAVNNNKIDISAPSIGSGWGSVVVPCAYGDVFVFTGQGVANPPAYAFIRSDGSVKIKDTTETYLNRTQLVAPTEAVYAVFNNSYSFVEKPFVFKYRYKTTVPNLDTKIIRTTYANDLNYNALFDEYRTTSESNGISITTTETGFHIAGTAVRTFAYDLVREYTGFLSIFTPNEKYRIEADLPNNVALQVAYAPTAGISETVLLSVWGSTDTVITMPASTPYTLRVSLVFINGTTYDNDVQVNVHRVGYDGVYKTSWYNGSLLETVHAAKKQHGSLILLDSGSYDIVAEFIAKYGETFFTNYNKSVADGWGVELTNGIVLRGMSDTVVTCNPGTYQTSTNNIRDYFSPFMYVGDCTVENIKIIAKNCKYCIHDDWLDKNIKTRHVTENCVLIKDDTYNRCYGSGFTKSSEIIIRNCYFQDNTQAPVSIHNVISSDAKSKAIIEGCYFENGTIRLGHYGASTEKSTVYIHGNSYKAAPYVVFEDQSSYANENMEYIAWCNEIRS